MNIYGGHVYGGLFILSLSGFYAFSHVFIGLLAIHCPYLIVSYSLRFVLVPFQSSGVRNLRSVLCVALRVALVGVVSIATCHYCMH